MITFYVTFDANGTPSATWTGSGAFTDAGSVVYTKLDFLSQSTVTFTEHVNTIQTGSRGTFAMDFHRTYGHPTTRSWSIQAGAGAYSALHGVGSWDIFPTGPNTLTIIASCDVQFD